MVLKNETRELIAKHAAEAAMNVAIVSFEIAQRAETHCARGNFIEGVETILLGNLYVEQVLETPGNGQKDVSALLKRAMGHLTRKPFETVSLLEIYPQSHH